jgi:hypothetical protein
MMGHQAHLGHVLKHAAEAVDEMKPLNSAKNAWAAFFIGLFFGFIGVGLYLNSLKDFFFSFFLFLVIVLLFLPTGVGEAFGVPLGWLAAAVYGAYRVHSSNQRL